MAQELEDILDHLADTAIEEKISIGELLDSFQSRSLGVLLALFGVLTAIPVIGGLPGAPLVLCTFILVAIGQSVFAKGGLWAPQRLRRIEIGSEKLRNGVKKVKPWARRIDALVEPRLEWLAGGRAARAIIIACSTVLALMYLPLSIVPWGVGAPAFALIAFGLALIGKDGLFALFGYVFGAGTVYLVFTAVRTGVSQIL